MYPSPFIASDTKIKEHAVMALSALYGCEELSKYAPPDGQPDGFAMLSSVGEEIFKHQMVALAAMVRAVDDEFDTLAQHQKQNPLGVGELENSKGSQILTAREACNKILHARHAKIEWKVLAEHPYYEQKWYLQYGDLNRQYNVPFLHVSGTHYGEGWCAVINLVLWVHAVSFFT
ncbi:hypothetical protein SAMN05216299_1276 [Nitrosospira sp. Nsp14]|nr:hypothetical protein SAMN05216299_1276 [Nitrosospira sp. Nsp14]